MVSTRSRKALGDAYGQFQRGRHAEAREILKALLAREPVVFDALLLLGIIEFQRGDPASAAQHLRNAAKADPKSPIALCNLGVAEEAQGRLEEAVAAFDGALRLKDDYFEAHFGRGNALRKLGRYEEALASVDCAIALNRGYAPAHSNRGSVLLLLKRPEEAIQSLTYAIALKKDFAEAYLNRGLALKASGRMQEARADLSRACSLQPDSVVAETEAGLLSQGLGFHAEALASFDRAIALKPDDARLYTERGHALLMLRRPHEAGESYERAMALDPALSSARNGRISAYFQAGLQPEAERLCEELLEAEPDALPLRATLTFLTLPPVADDQQAAAVASASFDARLDDLAARMRASEGAWEHVGFGQPFFSAYHETDNRPMLERHGAMCVEAMSRWPGLPEGSVPPSGSASASADGRLRVGIVSADIRNHSVWHALIRGWVEHLDRTRFDVQIFALSGIDDKETAWARSKVSEFHQNVGTYERWARVIAASRPDVLIFPAIGLDQLSLQLASLRLARLQAASWGHPETSGLATIDGYISADAFEPPEADAYYTEELVRLPGIGCHYAPLPVVAEDVDPRRLGLDAARPLALCPGTPFKYTPRHDAVLVEIARRCPGATLAFFRQQDSEGFFQQLQRRLERSFRDAGLRFEDHCTVLPWLTAPQFHGVMRRASVVLDTMGFSGFNTCMQALQSNAPFVAFEGRFMRGRLASGILRSGGLDSLVARDEGEFVERATDVLGSPGRREEISVAMAAAYDRLCNDVGSIRALEDWIEKRTASPS